MKSRHLSTKSLLTVILALLLSSVPRPLAAHSEKGWVLERQNIFGKTIVYMDSRGIRMTWPDIGYNVLVKAPDYSVVHFNTSSKTEMDESLAHFCKRRGMESGIACRHNWPTEKTTYAGIRARKISVRTKNFQRNSIAVLPAVRNEKKAPVVAIEYFVSDSIRLPRSIYRFFSAFHTVPDLNGIPLALNDRLSDGKIKPVWYTISVKRETIPATIFAEPRNYKKVNHWGMVFGGGISGTIDNIAEDLGVGDKFGK
ncbi:MAG TPA: hypothetical protein V6D17_19825 [Candidatus Obscuribacterales bacterium]